MVNRSATILFLIYLPAGTQAQTSARDLYYKDMGPQDAVLGLRLQLRKLLDGKWTPVNPAAVFRSGDEIRLDLESNRQAHLYVAARGSDGSWSVLFPSSGPLGTASRVFPNRPVSIEAQFDGRPGIETLHIALLAGPEADKAKLIEQMQTAPDNAGRKGQAELLERDLRYEAASPAHEFSAFLVSRGKRLSTRILLRHE